jgi:hypothetical protein
MVTKANLLRQAQIQVIGLEQELTDLGYELAGERLGKQAVQHLRGLGVRLLYGRSKGEVSERLLFAALEDAWSAGASRARGGVPGPAPVQHQPGTPPWLHHLSIELEDAMVRFPHRFTDEQKSQIRGAFLALRELASASNGRDGHGAG